MVERERKRAHARGMMCGAFAAMLAAVGSGCTTSNTSNASLVTSVSAAAGPTIAFESIDGPPVGVFNRLVDNLSSEAQARQLAIASREGAATYRVRGYLAAQVVQGRTHVSWVWDVYDDDRLRTLRITGEEAGGRPGGDPWSVADEPMLRRIARASMDRLAAHFSNPSAPGEPGASTAIAASEPEAAAKPRGRRARSATVPSAAERLAMSAAH